MIIRSFLSTDLSFRDLGAAAIRLWTSGKWSHCGVVFQTGPDLNIKADLIFESVWKVDHETGKTGLRCVSIERLYDWRVEDPAHHLMELSPPLPLTDEQVCHAFDFLCSKVKTVKYGALEILENAIGWYHGRGNPARWRCPEPLLYALAAVHPDLLQYFDVPLVSGDMLVPSGIVYPSQETAVNRMLRCGCSGHGGQNEKCAEIAGNERLRADGGVVPALRPDVYDAEHEPEVHEVPAAGEVRGGTGGAEGEAEGDGVWITRA